MEQLFELQNLLIEQFEQITLYTRSYFDKITYDNYLTGIVGSRGVGKTTFLLHQAIARGAKDRKALYISADSYYLIETPLIKLVDKLYKETDVRMLFIDEIQKYPSWNQELKNIADTYRDFRILFTGSSMIDIIHAKYDLSRRATIHHVHGLSFREYLEFKLGLELPIYQLNDIIENHTHIADNLNINHILKHHKEYLRVGYYPYFGQLTVDLEKYQAVESAALKTIYEDTATLHSMKTSTLLTIEKLYKYVVSSLPGEISAYKLASALGKDYESVSEYLHILEQAGLIRFLFSAQSGKAALRNPIKMYPDNTNLIYSAQLPMAEDALTGKARETFVINQLQNSNVKVFYSKQGDFKVDDYIFEVGRKNKSNKQIKDSQNGYILADGILTGFKNKIPLYLLGFLS